MQEIGAFNSIKEFNSLYNNNLNNFKLDNNSTGGTLKGGVEFSVPQNIGIKNTDLINDQELVQDLKALSTGANAQQNSGAVDISSPDKLAKSFAKALDDGITNLNQSQKTAEQAVETFAAGGNIDVHTVMIAAKKSQLSMQLALQLRNKIVQAYQEVSRIHV